MTPARRAALIKTRAIELGFDAVGIADLQPSAHAQALGAWLDAGMAGSMTYMGRQAGRRKHPASILDGADRCVVVVKYYSGAEPDHPVDHGHVAKYARGRDYHDALRAPLEQLGGYIRELGGARAKARTFIDAGPVPERELAQRAGLGWIGKNTMLIDPRRGSYSLIGSVLTDVDLAVDPAFPADHCGNCTRCLDACPTDAFVAPRVLDARRCISYLTIEYRGTIEPELARQMGDWTFGCDVCQDVCPWNIKFATSSLDPMLEQDAGLAWIDLAEMAAISDAEFAMRFEQTALARPGAAGMRRNARITRGNQREALCREP
ncbi:MAG TPA: tRNA epoxyqueuosine(34) reductase QueG [Gemmatimonadales bacterium]